MKSSLVGSARVLARSSRSWACFAADHTRAICFAAALMMDVSVGTKRTTAPPAAFASPVVVAAAARAIDPKASAVCGASNALPTAPPLRRLEPTGSEAM